MKMSFLCYMMMQLSSQPSPLTLWKKNLTRVNCDKLPKLCKFLTGNGSTQPHSHGMTHCLSPQRTIYRPLWRIQDVKI